MHLYRALLTTFHAFDFGFVSRVIVKDKVGERFPEQTQAETKGGGRWCGERILAR